MGTCTVEILDNYLRGNGRYRVLTITTFTKGSVFDRLVIMGFMAVVIEGSLLLKACLVISVPKKNIICLPVKTVELTALPF